MKKLLTLVLTLVFCMSFAVSAFAAEYTVGADGNAVYDNAIGYVFDIEDVNGTITGEDATIITTNDAMANIGSIWSIWFLAEAVDEGGGAYVVKSNGAAMGGAAPSVNLADNQIVVVVHSSSSNPNDADTFPNWEDKVAALAVKTGDWIVFDGIDLELGISDNGRIMIVTKDDVLAGNFSWPDGETGNPGVSAGESEDTSENSEDTVESQEPTDAESEENTATDGDKEPEEASDSQTEETDTDIKTSDIEIDGEDSGLGIWLWGIIGAAVVVVVVIIIIAGKKSSKQ